VQEEGAQLGFVHSPRAQPPLAQTLPHAPQLLGSVWKSGPAVVVAVATTVIVGVKVSVPAIFWVAVVVTVTTVSVKAVEVEMLVSVAVLLTTTVTVWVARERHSQALVTCAHSYC